MQENSIYAPEIHLEGTKSLILDRLFSENSVGYVLYSNDTAHYYRHSIIVNSETQASVGLTLRMYCGEGANPTGASLTDQIEIVLYDYRNSIAARTWMNRSNVGWAQSNSQASFETIMRDPIHHGQFEADIFLPDREAPPIDMEHMMEINLLSKVDMEDYLPLVFDTLAHGQVIMKLQKKMLLKWGHRSTANQEIAEILFMRNHDRANNIATEIVDHIKADN